MPTYFNDLWLVLHEKLVFYKVSNREINRGQCLSQDDSAIKIK